jgi:hypothetical protein
MSYLSAHPHPIRIFKAPDGEYTPTMHAIQLGSSKRFLVMRIAGASVNLEFEVAARRRREAKWVIDFR